MSLVSQLKTLQTRVAKFESLPVLKYIAPDHHYLLTKEHLDGFAKAQELALRGAKEIAAMMQEGWSERMAASMLTTWLADHNVESYFHRPYAWFGDRTRFSGISRRNYAGYMPTTRRILEGDAFILDVAPIVDGYTCDIGYSGSLGANTELDAAMSFLAKEREAIRQLFAKRKSGREIWQQIDQDIKAAGYDNIHEQYPFSVLGHRLHRNSVQQNQMHLLNFGWQSYWSLLARGVFGQIFTPDYAGDLEGIWAIEPHIGAKDFGAKFEEILIVSSEKVYWLSEANDEL